MEGQYENTKLKKWVLHGFIWRTLLNKVRSVRPGNVLTGA
jgi:hypothetical protein